MSVPDTICGNTCLTVGRVQLLVPSTRDAKVGVASSMPGCRQSDWESRFPLKKSLIHL